MLDTAYRLFRKQGCFGSVNTRVGSSILPWPP